MRILAIDPGPERSGVVIYDTSTRLPVGWDKVDNRAALLALAMPAADVMAYEMVASYGMAVGKDVFETVWWTGRFVERWRNGGPGLPRDDIRVFRREVKLHLCESPRANDSNIRQALIDRYGGSRRAAVGVKAEPGPLYGFKADCWSALAVAITAAETKEFPNG